jgi:23S rRNA (pseudouridine1915-N3)-methyltransferase
VKLRLVALAHKLPAWTSAAFSEYVRRLPREFTLELIELKPGARDTGKSAAQILAAEAGRIAQACTGFDIVALDEQGEMWTTARFAQRLGEWSDEARAIAFVIGSADGLDPQLKRNAHVRLSLSAMTLPHALARVVLAEQIYRAVSVRQGHPYHRE